MNYDSYFSELLERESDAEKVRFRGVSRSDWSPKKNDCHNNVDYWVAHHHEIKVVRGWLFWGPNEALQYNLMAHSVIDDDGALVDITPLDENTPREALRFLRHLGTEEKFAIMRVPCSHVLYPPISFEEWRESQLPIQEEEADF
jgi:hypothetical protein